MPDESRVLEVDDEVMAAALSAIAGLLAEEDTARRAPGQGLWRGASGAPLRQPTRWRSFAGANPHDGGIP